MTSLIDDFEISYQNLLNLLTRQEFDNEAGNSEVKLNAEYSMQNFLDASKNLDTFFVQKKLILSSNPIREFGEDLEDYQCELQRKDQLIQRQQDNLKKWIASLNRSHGAHIVQAPPQISTQSGQQMHQASPQINSEHGTFNPHGPLAHLEQSMSNIGSGASSRTM